MYKILKEINETTMIADCDNRIYILKKTAPDEAEMYKKLIQLNHKNVIKIYELTVTDGEFYAVEEYCHGTTLEKYIQEFFGNLFDDASPLGMIPLVRDIVSICKGYNVDRSDMSMVKNIVNQIKSISDAFKDLPESDNVVWDGAKITGNVLATFGQVVGIPLGNINRDVWGVVNTIAGETKPGKVTGRGIVDSIKSSIPFAKERKKDERLYEAWCAGDADEYAKVAGMYGSGDSIKSALGKHIKEDYMAGRITYDQARAMLIKAEYDEGRVDTTIKNWDKSDDSDEGEDKHAGLYTLN